VKKMITEKSKLAEIIKIKGAEDTLHKFGVPCISCPMAKMEMDKLELGMITEMYGLDLEGLLKELNKKKK